ncbi:hypothetical protein [Heyndrickxia oleronia]|uniref:hypothetical protein n=1 Tax=Heyndrickxia oleronia TaxID=38875 RepID=UPI00242DCD96|nr:hypothetical protein [Heyndrickxia oleronia]MCI1615971.1 hypothetical protein [Heyndrickxia oleronia]
MEYKFQYSTPQERERILEDNASKILIEEQNIAEGNFLIFSDAPIEKEVEFVNIPQSEIDSIKQSIAELSLLIAQMGGM